MRVGRAVEQIGTGQTGANFRLHLDGERARTSRRRWWRRPRPATGAQRERVGAGYRNEVGFYTVFRDRVQIRTPRCWHAEISDDNCSFVLLLDDLAPARPGVQVDGVHRRPGRRRGPQPGRAARAGVERRDVVGPPRSGSAR